MRKLSIFSWFGFSIPMEDRYKLIKAAGFDGVLLWWSDEYAEVDGDKSHHPELARQNKLSGGLPDNIIKDMFMKTLEGTLKLITENDLSFDEVISRVATKGGITEEGIRVLQAGLPETLDIMFDKAIKKRNFISETVNQKF